MSHLVLTDAFVSINAVDLSAHVRAVTVNYSSELQDDTNMADTTRVRLGGLLDWSFEVEFAQDFAAALVDATLFPLVGVTTTVLARPTSAAVSATNPNYTGTGILETYPPLGNSVGELATTSVTFQAAGVLSRAVA